MPDYEKYGFRNTVVDRLINRPVFNANKMPVRQVAQPRDLEQQAKVNVTEAKIKELSKTLNVPVEDTRVNLGENSAITFVAGAVGGGVKAIIKAAAKQLAKKGAIKGASSLTE